MTISAALSNAVTGLTAASRRAEVISDNVANALTEGYARRQVEVSPRVTGGAGAGVRVDDVTRAEHPRATADRRRAEAGQGRDAAMATAQARISGAIGAPEDPGSLSARALTFENAVGRLAETPESATLQADAAAAASAMAGSLVEATGEVQRVRMDADRSIGAMVTTINDALSRIVELNRRIETGSVAGRPLAALQEARAREVDRISALVPVRIADREHGAIALYTPGGALLLDGRAAELGFDATGLITPDMTLASGALGALTLDGDPIAAGTGRGKLDGGALGAQFAIRDVDAPAAQDQLDAIAEDLILRFEDPALDPTLAVGDPGLFTDEGGVFDPLDVVGLAGRIRINAAVDPAQGGEVRRMRDGINALVAGDAGEDDLPRAMLAALADPRTAPAGAGFGGDRAFADLVSAVSAVRAQAEVESEAAASYNTGRFSLLKESEAALIGVDSDREMSDLLLVEQAYAANARVIATVDGLLRRLMDI